MGHQRLGTLPRSKKWRDVVALLNGGGGEIDIAAATSRAAEQSMIDAANDAAVRHAFWLLTQIPHAARDDDPIAALEALGLDIATEQSLPALVASMVEAIDRELVASGKASDYGEMAELAAAESLYAIASREPDLLGETPERLLKALGRLTSPNAFAVLARDYFARLTRRHLSYFLSRELALHTGPGQRFTTLREQDAFEEALNQHCREASRIIKEFAATWFSKHVYEGGIDRGKAGRFVHRASRKVRDELASRRTEDA